MELNQKVTPTTEAVETEFAEENENPMDGVKVIVKQESKIKRFYQKHKAKIWGGAAVLLGGAITFLLSRNKDDDDSPLLLDEPEESDECDSCTETED